MRDSYLTPATDADENHELEQSGMPFRALYEHWERNQWSSLDLDLRTDAESFRALDDEARQGFVWIFAHRFHAEFKVATLLCPFLEHAPDYEMQVLIATQIADEHRHLQSVMRVYGEVLGIEGGVRAVKANADSNIDLVASTLYDAFDEVIEALARTGERDDYVRAVVAYHVIAEGVVARTAQNLAAGQYERYGSFPGLAIGQRLVARDEARHIGIGVSYLRRCMAEDRARTTKAIRSVVTVFAEMSDDLLERALAGQMDAQVMSGYGVEPEGFYAEAMRLFQIRMRAIGLAED